MYLSYVRIRNFRSIKDVKIEFNPTCRILVGINESGKTNILKALSLLNPDLSPTLNDLRDFLPDESPNQEALIEFIFKFDEKDKQIILNKIYSTVVSKDKKLIVLSINKKQFSLSQIFKLNNQKGFYQIDLQERTKNPNCWAFSEISNSNSKILGDWVKPSKQCPQDIIVTTLDGKSQKLHDRSFIQRSSLPKIPDACFSNVDLDDIKNIFYQQIRNYIKENLPICLFWKYSDSYLLPGQQNLDTFTQNPDSCVPLKNMFALAGFTNIVTTIKNAKEKPNGLRNLLNKVADCSTKYIHTVWKDYKEIKIKLEPNGTNIDASIHEKHNRFNFDRRSDGFKRFISFLLMVSVPVKTKELINTLYLHDEPDTSLHPSGERFLLEELIKISNKNYVVFSTHSIFMIDREVLRRHLIVEKNGEITSVREVGASNICDEEVIYNALGYSIFENLKEQNIIFEGWRDKKLFEVALKNLSPKIKNKFKKVGFCYANGVKDICRITPMLELARRKWIVVSDGDDPAVQHQKIYKGKGPWLRYDELLPKYRPVTGEDFIKPNAFKSALEKVASRNPSLSKFPLNSLSAGIKKLEIIKAWLKAGRVPDNSIKDIINEIKENIFNNLEPSQIDLKYYELLKNLQKKL